MTYQICKILYLQMFIHINNNKSIKKMGRIQTRVARYNADTRRTSVCFIWHVRCSLWQHNHKQRKPLMFRFYHHIFIYFCIIVYIRTYFLIQEPWICGERMSNCAIIGGYKTWMESDDARGNCGSNVSVNQRIEPTGNNRNIKSTTIG